MTRKSNYSDNTGAYTHVGISLAEKIKIFKAFAETGEKLNGNTEFLGYNIGEWATRIRSDYNNERLNIEKEQFEELKNLGIFERQIDSTIDEKIVELLEWRKKYPQITIVPAVSAAEIRKYAKTDEDFRALNDKYEVMKKYYAYLRVRKNQGKLGAEREQRCKEGGIGGIFGYLTRIEELARRYGIKEKKIYYLLNKFGTIDDFYKMYNTGNLEDKDDIELAKIIIRDVVDVDNNSNVGYDRLYRDIVKNGDIGQIDFYSSNQLQEVLETLTSADRNMVNDIYGLTEENASKGVLKIAEQKRISTQRVYQIKEGILGNLRRPDILQRFKIDFEIEHLTDSEKMKFEEIIKNIQLQRGELAENLEKLNKIKETSRKSVSDLVAEDTEILADTQYMQAVNSKLAEKSRFWYKAEQM